jgi:hypothetical protein
VAVATRRERATSATSLSIFAEYRVQACVRQRGSLFFSSGKGRATARKRRGGYRPGDFFLRVRGAGGFPGSIKGYGGVQPQGNFSCCPMPPKKGVGIFLTPGSARGNVWGVVLSLGVNSGGVWELLGRWGIGWELRKWAGEFFSLGNECAANWRNCGAIWGVRLGPPKWGYNIIIIWVAQFASHSKPASSPSYPGPTPPPVRAQARPAVPAPALHPPMLVVARPAVPALAIHLDIPFWQVQQILWRRQGGV